jgi:hypothetical protein
MPRKPDIAPPGDLEEALNPHRAEEQAHARDHAVSVLVGRGVRLAGDERDEELADLWSAVERFESTLSARGADTMTNAPGSADPDNPAFVLPERLPGESAAEYTRRILDAAHRLSYFERS